MVGIISSIMVRIMIRIISSIMMSIKIMIVLDRLRPRQSAARISPIFTIISSNDNRSLL